MRYGKTTFIAIFRIEGYFQCRAQSTFQKSPSVISEGALGFEPRTSRSAGECSTTELCSLS